MKKRLSTVLIALIFLFTAQPVFAETDADVELEYLPDGSYYITILEEVTDTNSGDAIQSRAAVKTTTHSKTTIYRNASHKDLWYVKVTGTFTYGNGSATCTKATASAGSYVDAWKIISKSASKSGSKATAKATAKRYVDGTAVQTVKDKTVTLTCSPSGNCS